MGESNRLYGGFGRPSRRALLRATGGVLAVASTGVVGTAGARPGSTQTIIDDCTTITESGRYALADDIDASDTTGACIQIEADDVVLDGRNHTIDGGGTGFGVLVGLPRETIVENVTVENLEVTRVDSGIAYTDTRGGAIHNVTVSSAGAEGVPDAGIACNRAQAVTVTACTITENNTSVFLADGSSNNVFARNHITNNEDGVFVTEFSTANAFRQNRIDGNEGSGIQFNDGSSEPELVGNIVRNNGGNGISLEMLTGALVERNQTIGARGEGANVGDGIRLVEVDESRMVKNISRDNADDGIDLAFDSDNNEIVKNKLLDNGDEAIAISDTSTGNTLSGNITR